MQSLMEINPQVVALHGPKECNLCLSCYLQIRGIKLGQGCMTLDQGH